MKTVQAQPFPSTDFRITILMLILAIVIKIKLTEIIFRNKENSFSEIDVFLRNKKANQFWVFPLALSVVCLFPFEFLTKYLVHKPKETEYLASEFKFSKVYQGDNFFSKTDFINLEENRLQIKFISDFTFFEKTGEFIISGTREAVVLDENRQFKEKIQFKLGKSEDKNYPEAHFQKVKPIDIENDGIAEFIGVGSYPYNGFILNHQGEIIWRYSEVQDTISLESVEIKDIDGDKLPEIVVIEKGTRNEKGEKFGIIKSFDLKTKKEKWSQTINNGFFSQDVDLIDIDLDGKDEIVTWATKNQNNNGSILNQKGEEIQKIKIPYKNNGFLIEKDEKPQILFFAENKLGLFDFNGNLNAKYETPFSEIENKNIFREERDLYLKLVSVYQANAIKIKLKIDQLKFLAVLANISTRLSDENVDMMYVYDSQGNLVYQESIKGQCTIEKLRNENGTESLILVENEKIKFYKAN